MLGGTINRQSRRAPNPIILILCPLSGRSGHGRTRCFPASVVNDPKADFTGSAPASGLAGAWVSAGPGMSLKRRFERRLGDAAGVVRDRGRGDRGDHFAEVIFTETGCEELIDVLLI